VNLAMTQNEREEFLAGVHVGVLAVADTEVATGVLAVPVWYWYVPGGSVDVITGGESRKARCLRSAGRFSLCTQTETAPYQYVSVDGPIVAESSPVSDNERRAMAHRYLGAELGDLYLAATEEDAGASVVFRMSPRRWFTTNFAKQFDPA
jgi:nitroimidazol reductase NimA-like FMN-containing flavoprotein (pyridoxamine 5'-phosphate oxidase superfamily)